MAPSPPPSPFHPPRPGPQRLTLPRTRRLAHARQYDAVYAGKMKKSAGPVVVFGVTNDRPFCRLGIAVGRKAGPAATRSRLKRLVREAFRLCQHDLPRSQTDGDRTTGYDLVVAVRTGPTTIELDDVRAGLLAAADAIHEGWRRRAARAAGEGTEARGDV